MIKDLLVIKGLLVVKDLLAIKGSLVIKDLLVIKALQDLPCRTVTRMGISCFGSLQKPKATAGSHDSLKRKTTCSHFWESIS